MIKYKIQAKANPFNRDNVKYYPQIVSSSVQTIDTIVKRISKHTMASKSDVRGVIEALEEEIIDALERGETVRLGTIGTFRPTISADGADTAKEARSQGANLIKKLNVNFKKSSEMETSLKVENLEFQLASDVINATDADEETSDE